MRFLFRIIFWFGLVLVLLPRDKTSQPDKGPQIGAAEAVQAATAAVSDMSQFCKRQPAACEVGGQAATIIGHRAQDGARRLYHIITEPDRTQKEKKAPDRTGSIGGADPAVAEAPPETMSQDNLTQDDQAVEWRAPEMPN